MQANELRKKDVAELSSELKALLQESFNLRMQRKSQEVAKSHLMREVRRNIARVKTVLREKR